MPTSGRRLLRALPLALAIGLIALLTLEPRPRQAPLSASTPWYCLVCGGLGTVDVVLNLALFVPLGLALHRLGFGRLRCAMTGLLVSGMVELLQATIVTGRDPSLSDLVTNTLGTLFGGQLAGSLPGLVWPSAARARSLAEKAAGGWILLLAFTGWAVQPVDGPAEATFRIAPTMPGLDRFPGAISAATFNGVPARGSLDTAQVASALARRSLSMEATASLLAWTDALAPIVDVVDRRWVAAAQLGQVGQKIVFSVRSRSEQLRLRAPTVKVYRALPRPRGQTFTAGGRLEGNSLSAFATAGTVTHRAQTRLTPGLGWMLVLPFGSYPFDYRPEITSAIWTALPLLLVGFWTGASGARVSVMAGRWAALIGVGLLAIPPLTGAARQGWETWVTCAAALLVGRLAAAYASAGTSATLPPRARSAASP